MPRQTSVRDIVEVIGCSKSTAANHPRNTEPRRVRHYNDRSATK
ncbi:hypothetical protein [Natronomonas gomsonensis]